MRGVARLGAFRGHAESLMGDTLSAYAFTWATIGGLKTRAWVLQYTTPGKVAGRSRQGGDTSTRIVTVGDAERYVLEGGLHIPLSAGLPAVGWEFECTAVGAGSDASLVGRRWRVVDVPAKSFATARRLDVYEVEPPVEA